MDSVRVYSLCKSGSRYACALAMCILIAISSCLTGFAAPVLQEPAGNSDVERRLNDELIQAWINQLTSDDFGIRESARNHLLSGGTQVLPHLKKNLDATNSELRLSIARLYEMITDEVASNQIESFLGRKSSLPGWQIFKIHYGNTDENRRLYAEVFRGNQDLIEQLERADSSRSELLDRLIRTQEGELSHSSRPNIGQLPVLATVVSELFEKTRRANSSVETGRIPLQVQISLAQLIADPGFVKWINEPNQTNTIVLRSIASWVTATTDSPILISSKISVAHVLGLRESIPLCLQCIDSRDIPAANRRTAMELLVRFGDHNHVAALEKHIEDSLLVYRASPNANRLAREATATCQMGDVALASLILIVGQDLQRFGFAQAGTSQGRRLPNVNQLVFTDDDARQKARQKWREYRAANLD